MTPYLSQISVFAFGRTPSGWLPCNGQLLPINSNQALFSLLGVTYGGDGIRTFGLPNLQGRVPLGYAGDNPQGTLAGVENVTLTTVQMPAHTHPVVASSSTASLVNPVATNFPANSGNGNYAAAANTLLDGGSSPSGGQPHSNLQPYQVAQYCIAITGIFPPRN